MKFVVRAPDTLIEELDKLIDGRNFRSRNQLINIILADWLAWETIPDERTSTAHLGRVSEGVLAEMNHIVTNDGQTMTRNEARNHMRRQLLGDDWDKYQHSNAIVFQEDETGEVNRQVRELERNQDEMKARIEALEAAIAKISGAPATQPEEPQNESRKSKRGQAAKPKRSK